MKAILDQLRRAGLEAIPDKLQGGRRLECDDGLRLYRAADLTAVGDLASLACERRSGRRTSDVRNLHVNDTDVCWVQRKCCTSSRLPGQERGSVLPAVEIFRKIQAPAEKGGTEILIQGGLNPALKIEYCEGLFRALKARFPVHRHGLSPVEIISLARISRPSERDGLRRLQAAGLDSIPGAGARCSWTRCGSRSPRSRARRRPGWI